MPKIPFYYYLEQCTQSNLIDFLHPVRKSLSFTKKRFHPFSCCINKLLSNSAILQTLHNKMCK